MRTFEYADYEADPGLRNPELLARMQAPYVELFKGCRRVLDLACGSGIFLELLRQAGIPALGVERNEQVVAADRERGFNVAHADAIDFLAGDGERFDGIYCSHFIEHLPFDQLVRLIELIAGRLVPEGRLVLVFPNPESIRMQLFGFWKDPEHVRFYHAELIELVCRHYGLAIETTNKDDTPLLLGPVTFELPRLEGLGPGGSVSSDTGVREPQSRPPRLLDRVLRWLAVPTERDLEELKEELQTRLQDLQRRAELFEGQFGKNVEEYNVRAARAVDALNKIWSRGEEIVMVCRKRSGIHAG